MKMALVIDWLTTYAGAQKVEEAILKMFPDADIFTCIYNESVFKGTLFEKHTIKQSFISKLPKAIKWYQKYLPLMPYAIEQFDLSSYDIVISSSHAVAKGVLTGPDQLHICYCHTPMRYAWDFQHQYLKEANLKSGLKSVLARYFLHKLRIWDYRTSNGVDFFIANSNYIAKRIKKVYGRSSEVIYPNVNTVEFDLENIKNDYYVTASRLVPYKKVPLIVEAFSKMPDKKLIVIGSGEQENKVKHFLSSNIEFLGHQSFDNLKRYMQGAKAFVFAAEEDFGIVPIEAQACGTPVIAYGKGGALETVIDKKTGIFFKQQTVSAIAKAVQEFEKSGVQYTPSQIRKHSEKFSQEQFCSKFKCFIELHYDNFLEKNSI